MVKAYEIFYDDTFGEIYNEVIPNGKWILKTNRFGYQYMLIGVKSFWFFTRYIDESEIEFINLNEEKVFLNDCNKIK